MNRYKVLEECPPQEQPLLLGPGSSRFTPPCDSPSGENFRSAPSSRTSVLSRLPTFTDSSLAYVWSNSYANQLSTGLYALPGSNTVTILSTHYQSTNQYKQAAAALVRNATSLTSLQSLRSIATLYQDSLALDKLVELDVTVCKFFLALSDALCLADSFSSLVAAVDERRGSSKGVKALLSPALLEKCVFQCMSLFDRGSRKKAYLKLKDVMRIADRAVMDNMTRLAEFVALDNAKFSLPDYYMPILLTFFALGKVDLDIESYTGLTTQRYFARWAADNHRWGSSAPRRFCALLFASLEASGNLKAHPRPKVKRRKDLHKVDGYCALRYVPRSCRWTVGLVLGPEPTQMQVLTWVYALCGPRVSSRFPHCVELATPKPDAYHLISRCSDLVGAGRAPFSVISPTATVGAAYASAGNNFKRFDNAQSLLGGTMHKDGLAAPYVPAVLNDINESLEISPYAMSAPLASLLATEGIPVNPNATGAHPHPANKTIENFMLLSKVPHLLTQQTTVMFMKPQKFARLRAKTQLAHTLVNVQLTGKDSVRYPGSQTSWPASIDTPSVFMHDAGHHFTQAQVVAFFQRYPKVDDLVISGIFPVEAASKSKSFYPLLYTLDYRSDGFTYCLEGKSSDGYHHAYNSLNWLRTGTITQTRKASDFRLKNPDNLLKLSVTLLDQTFAHKVFRVSRRAVVVPETVRYVTTPDEVKLPNSSVSSKMLSSDSMPREVFRDVLMHAMSLTTKKFEGVLAKVRTYSSNKSFAHVDPDSWISMANVVYSLATSGVALTSADFGQSDSAKMRRYMVTQVHPTLRRFVSLADASVLALCFSCALSLRSILSSLVDLHFSGVVTSFLPFVAISALALLVFEALGVWMESRSHSFVSDLLGDVSSHVVVMFSIVGVSLSLSVAAAAGSSLVTAVMQHSVIRYALLNVVTLAAIRFNKWLRDPALGEDLQAFLKNLPRRREYYVRCQDVKVHIHKLPGGFTVSEYVDKSSDPSGPSGGGPDSDFTPPSLWEQAVEIRSTADSSFAGLYEFAGYEESLISFDEPPPTAPLLVAPSVGSGATSVSVEDVTECEPVHKPTSSSALVEDVAEGEPADEPLLTARGDGFESDARYEARTNANYKNFELDSSIDQPAFVENECRAHSTSVRPSGSVWIEESMGIPASDSNFPYSYSTTPSSMVAYSMPSNDCLIRAYCSATGSDPEQVWHQLCLGLGEEHLVGEEVALHGLTTESLHYLGLCDGLRVRLYGDVPPGHPKLIGHALPTCSKFNFEEVHIHYAPGHWSHAAGLNARGGSLLQRPKRGTVVSPAKLPAVARHLLSLPDTVGGFYNYRVNNSRAKLYVSDLKNGHTGLLARHLEGKNNVPAGFTSNLDSLVDSSLKPRHLAVSVRMGFSGCAKSSPLQNALGAEDFKKNFLKNPNFSVALPRSNIREDWKKKLDWGSSYNWRINTFEVALTRPVETIILDEISQFPPGFVDLLAYAMPQLKAVIIIGDVKQGFFHEPSSEAKIRTLVPEAIHFAGYCETYLEYSHTLPLMTSKLLNVRTTSTKPGFIKMRHHVVQNVPLLTPGDADMKMYNGMGVESYTYSGCQGKRWPIVQIVLSSAAVSVVAPGLIQSAMSRATEGFYVILQGGVRQASLARTNVALHKLFNSTSTFDFQTQFASLVAGMNVRRAPNLRGANPELPVQRASLPLQALLRNNWEGLPEHYQPDSLAEPGPPTHLPEDDLHYHLNFFGELPPRESRELYLGNEQSAQFRDAERHMYNSSSYTGVEQWFPKQSASDPVTFKTAVTKRLRFADRVANRKEFLAKEFLGPVLLTSFLKVAGIDADNPPPFDPLLYAQCIFENEFNKLTQKSQSVLMNNADRADPDWRHTFVRIFVKGQLKAKMESIFCDFKAGQTLASFQDSVILITGPMTRYLVHQMERLRRPGLYYHGGRSPSQLSEWCRSNWRDTADNTINDYSSYDLSQRGEALAFEVQQLNWYSIPDDIVQYYYELKIAMHCQFGDLATLRHTGEGPTWKFNSDFNTAVVGLQYDTADSVPLAISGDDMAANGHLPVKDSWTHVKRYLTLVSKTQRVPTAEFCSWYLTPYGCIKIPTLTLLKLMIADDRGTTSLVEDNYASEIAVGYHLGDHLFKYLREHDLSAQAYLVRRFVTKLPLRFALMYSRRPVVDLLSAYGAAAADKVRLRSLDSVMWMLNSSVLRQVSASLAQGINQKRSLITF
uniref:Replicase polyprotein n=1 Tax=Wuhu tick virus 1 TaxID=2973975 RepID=A0A9E8AA04_9VIRU|nr:MAG: replicase polyprotein [Wuhu tick virus 1]